MSMNLIAVDHLIVNADDGFYSDPRDQGILEGLRAGRITDVSLIMNGVIATRLINNSQRKGLNPLYDHLSEVGMVPGLHVNLSEGYPLHQGCSSLVDEDGIMLGKEGLFQKVLSGEPLDLHEIEEEIELQLLRFVSLFGGPPSHVDGHQHAHVLPGINARFAKVMKKYDVLFTRVPVEWLPSSRSQKLPSEFHEQVKRYSRKSLKVFKEYGLRYPRFMGLSLMGANLTIDNLRSGLANIGTCDIGIVDKGSDGVLSCGLVEHVVELMVHPGHVSNCEGGCGPNGPDLFSQSEDRRAELQLLLSADFRNLVEEDGLTLTNFFNLSQRR